MTEEMQTQIRGIAAAVNVQTTFADDLIQRNVSFGRCAHRNHSGSGTGRSRNRQPGTRCGDP